MFAGLRVVMLRILLLASVLLVSGAMAQDNMTGDEMGGPGDIHDEEPDEFDYMPVLVLVVVAAVVFLVAKYGP